MEHPITIMLGPEELEHAARHHGKVPVEHPFMGIMVMTQEGKTTVAVMFSPEKMEGTYDTNDEPDQLLRSDRGAEKLLPAKPGPSGDYPFGEIPEEIKSDPDRYYTAQLLSYLLKEVCHEPPHLEVLHTSEHIHAMRHDEEWVSTGEITACFRMYGDPEHYAEGRPTNPSY